MIERPTFSPAGSRLLLVVFAALFLSLVLALACRAQGPDTLSWHAPVKLADGKPARDAQQQIGLRLRGQYPAYYPGIERDVQGWTALVAWCRPDTVFVTTALPGTACWMTVAPGQIVVVAINSAGPSCWSNIVVAK